MPELPEVEAVVRTLRPLVLGQRIRCAHVLHPIAVKPQSATSLVEFATGRRIRGVERQGKYVLLVLDRGLLTLHFRLDGQLVWFSNAKKLSERANRPENGVHVDVAFELSKGVLGFADRRHFGRVHAWNSPEDSPSLAALGIDAISKEFTPIRLRELLAPSSRPLKDFLLDQSRIAGLGNIYSCESLWHARLDPRRRANTVDAKESRRLHKAIVSVLVGALECCLHPPPDFRDAKWWFQGLEAILRAYDREGELCRRCGEAIQRIEQSGRSTYFCRRCQK
ncbi:MAG TPA: bifunctional DNA-formamidopyrimidine glycosylase/DNA-(apurinic or apyrimidinic site) lyase [Methylomirabilota bacterium]|nr:bifunctional DNA-formamidopyrimidine glycosylase/DNA-(apurinic or apyrimidinic site) lyase [Methylomirabilota bacterium]